MLYHVTHASHLLHCPPPATPAAALSPSPPMPDYAQAMSSLTGLGGLGGFNHLGDVSANSLAANMHSQLAAAQVREKPRTVCACACLRRVVKTGDDDGNNEVGTVLGVGSRGRFPPTVVVLCGTAPHEQVNALAFNPAVGLGSLHSNNAGGPRRLQGRAGVARTGIINGRGLRQTSLPVSRGAQFVPLPPRSRGTDKPARPALCGPAMLSLRLAVSPHASPMLSKQRLFVVVHKVRRKGAEGAAPAAA